MTARRLVASDLSQVAELERLCFSDPWSETALTFLLSDGALGAVVCEGDAVVAYGGMVKAPDEGQITNVAVHPDFRRRGNGEAVLRFLSEEAKKAGFEQVVLEVRASNLPAIALYRKEGFLQVGLRRRFYKNPSEDALILAKKIK